MTTYTTSNMSGADVAVTIPPESTTLYPYSAPVDFALGQLAQGTDGSRWVFVQANGAIGQYDFLGIDENFQAAPLTDAMAADGWMIGVSQVAFTDNYYGWVALNGANLQGNLAASVAADVPLRTGAVAGALDDVTSVGTQISGVVAVAGNTLTITSNFEVLLTYPRSATF